MGLKIGYNESQRLTVDGSIKQNGSIKPKRVE